MGRDASDHDHAEARGPTAKDTAHTRINDPGEVNTMNGSASKLHGDHRACGETCKGKGLVWWGLGKEGIQAIPAKDLLSLGQREMRAGQIRGDRGTCEDMCPALNEY